MKVHIHANCQAGPLASLLSEVCPAWDMTFFEVHGNAIIEKNDHYRQCISDADLVVSQPIHRNYRGRDDLSIDWIRDHIRPNAILLLFPSMHFSGHHIGLEGLPLETVLSPANALAGHLVATGCSPAQAVELLLSADLLSDAEIETEVGLSLEEMRRRELEDSIDIRISAFLDQIIRKRPLFHVPNHPFREMTTFVANAVLDRLGVCEHVLVEGKDYQPEPHIPPLPAVARFLRSRSMESDGLEEDLVKLHGHEPMSQADYYRAMIVQLMQFNHEEVFGAIEKRWLQVQMLRRLAESNSIMPGLGRWIRS